MPENHQNQNNAASDSSFPLPPDIIQERIRGMKIGEKEEEEEEKGADQEGLKEKAPKMQAALYPNRPGEPDCLYYLRTGTCRFGRNCRFNHPAHPPQAATSRNEDELPQRVGEPDCGFFLKTGTCKYGSTCKYHHPHDRHSAVPALLNSLGLPLRQDEKCCSYYMRTSTCKFGMACKFNHPQPTSITASIKTTFTTPKSASIGSSGSSLLPSTGLAYVGGLPPWLLSKPQFVSDPRVAGAQTYVPFLFSPSQGIVASQGWTTYVGNMNPAPPFSINLVPPTGFFGNNPTYNSKDQNDLGVNVQVNSLAANIALLPQRPDQPDCRYFMSTGSCKYGADCKYHHPTERNAHLMLNSLGPHGLPLRPGETACSNFSMYGTCKYGPACKFDHPISCYYSNFSFGIPYVSIPNQPSFASPRSCYPNVNLFETSPSKSRITDWIQKPDHIAEDKNHSSDVKSPEDSHEEANDHSRPQQASSELSHDQPD